MDQLRPYITQAETVIKGALKSIKEPAAKAFGKSVLSYVDPLLDRCSWSAVQAQEIAFYTLFAATIIFLTIAPRYTTKANKALIGFVRLSLSLSLSHGLVSVVLTCYALVRLLAPLDPPPHHHHHRRRLALFVWRIIVVGYWRVGLEPLLGVARVAAR